jgi:outer membrane receptor protein involved in Fe transport
MKRCTRPIRRVALSLLLLLAGARLASAQGVTTAAIQGTITEDGTGTAIDAARVELKSIQTGQTFAATTRSNGRFSFENVTPGSNYQLTVRAIGFLPTVQQGLILGLGTRQVRDLALKPSVVQLEAIEVAAEADNPLLDAGRTGPSQVIGDSAIQSLPLQGRNFTDLVNSTPQAVGTSIAGNNNRYNNIQIDGGVNNDLFGLAASGVPGGQSGARAISLEAVSEFQVLVAPYDVRQGNFAGGMVNGITKSGTNQFLGSAFVYRQSKSLAGYRDDPTFTSLSQWQYGATLGGPILTDKLHFFLSADIQSKESGFSSPFNLTGDDATDLANTGFTTGTVDQFVDILSGYGIVNSGDASTPNVENPLTNLFGKLSINTGESSQLELSYNYSDADLGAYIRNPTGVAITGRMRDGWQLSNSGYTQLGKVNTLRARWIAEFGGGLSNEFLTGYQVVRDSRDLPENVPLILTAVGNIGAATSWLAAGAERFSQTNSLDQDIFSFADNLSFGTGAHRFTVGTQNEFFSFDNAFFQASIGVWAFSSLDSLAAGTPSAFQRRIPTELQPKGPIALIGAQQFGLYVQDQWSPSERLSITLGIRADIPLINSPTTNPALVNDPFLPINTGDYPNANILWSPRLGFNWDVTGQARTIVRGGVGVFSGRPPYVWMANSFTNTGADFIQVTCTGAATPDFTVDPDAQPSACRTGTPTGVAGEVDYFDPNFKYPQNFRASLGFDQRLPGGFILTLDGYYAKQVNQIYMQDTNILQDPTVSGEGRAVYGTFDAANGRATTIRRTTAVTSAIYHTNTSAGQTLAGTIQVQKVFANHFQLNAAYTYSHTTDQISATSSQAFSNYQFASIGTGTIADRSVTTSFFDVPSKVTLTGTVDLPLGFDFSVFYTGFSGTPYGWVVNSGPGGTRGDANADGIAGNDLVFVPADPTQITLSNPAAYDSLQNFISSQKCLAAARGALLERNSCRNPWLNFFNLRFGWTTPQVKGSGIELTLDIFNFLNFLSSDWGLTKQVSAFEEGPAFLSVAGYDTVNDRPIYRFTQPAVVERTIYGQNTSRWTMQLGAKWRFGF